jgi:hypothetical protein
MWGSRRDGDDGPVTCIACGDEVPRDDAREYDKHGNRWERTNKEFEYLCKPCDRACCHQPRKGLEAMLVDIDAGRLSEEEFLARFHDATVEAQEHSD